MSAAVRSAAPPERERLVADFVRLCEIASPSQSERAVADAVAAELRDIGLEVEEDEQRATRAPMPGTSSPASRDRRAPARCCSAPTSTPSRSPRR